MKTVFLAANLQNSNSDYNKSALRIPPREAALNNNEAGSNDDDKGTGKKLGKVTQQTGVTVGFG